MHAPTKEGCNRLPLPFSRIGFGNTKQILGIGYKGKRQAAARGEVGFWAAYPRYPI